MRKITSMVLGLGVLLQAAVPSHAVFQSLQKHSVQAGVRVGGGMRLHIRHSDLTASSAITQQIMIIGEAGETTPAVPPPFGQRLTPTSDFGPIELRKIRVTVRYRYVPLETPQSQDDPEPSPPPEIPIFDLPPVEGPDPVAFAFLIPPSANASDILNYRIIAERLELQEGVLVPVSRTTYPAITSQNTEPWVEVRSRANASQLFTSQGGHFGLRDGNPVDGETAIDVPSGLVETPTTITMDEVPLNSPLIPGGLPNAVAVYRVDSDQPLRGFSVLSLLYRDFEFPQGADGVVDGSGVPVQNLSLYGWDGFAWRRLGGVLNAKSNTVSAKVNFFGWMALAAAIPLTPEGRRPLEKVITPNGDSHNEQAIFTVKDLTENYKIEIFDSSGHRVRTLMSGQNAAWDGRDDSGQIVESGVYIYQYTVEGKRISGLIAVAK